MEFLWVMRLRATGMLPFPVGVIWGRCKHVLKTGVPFYDRLALCLVTVLKENQVEGCANAIFGIISSKQKRG